MVFIYLLPLPNSDDNTNPRIIRPKQIGPEKNSIPMTTATQNRIRETFQNQNYTPPSPPIPPRRSTPGILKMSHHATTEAQTITEPDADPPPPTGRKERSRQPWTRSIKAQIVWCEDPLKKKNRSGMRLNSHLPRWRPAVGNAPGVVWRGWGGDPLPLGVYCYTPWGEKIVWYFLMDRFNGRFSIVCLKCRN